jgi:hypothetical protein
MSIFRRTLPGFIFLGSSLLSIGIALAEDPARPHDPAVDAALADALVAPAPGAGSADAAAAFAAGAPAAQDAGAATEAELLDPLQASFVRFCDGWMEKLAARERRNQGLIEWQTGSSWVQGSYVGYTQEHKCSIEGAGSKSPVGRLSYLEIKYERRGASVPDAMVADPHALETTEVTEFFRYSDKGEWVY